MRLGGFNSARGGIVSALASSTEALLAAQDSRGTWRDFPQVGGGSDEWVTGYIAAGLSGVPSRRVRAAVTRAWDALALRQRWSGGWGFMPTYPADADSTACALRVAEALFLGEGLQAWRGRAFLASHQRNSGGLATYVWPRRMAWTTGMRDRFDGWCAPHVCVSSHAALLRHFRGRHRLLEFLLAKQQPDGSWRSYWWYDERDYATAFAVMALAGSADPRHQEAVRRAIAWARCAPTSGGAVVSAAAPNGSAFATALRLQVLAVAAEEVSALAPRQAAVDWLLASQLQSGLWTSSAWLRFPPTDVADTSKISEWHIGRMVEAGVMSDGFKLFTTATVVSALQAVLAGSVGDGTN
jgi:squalene-hopene/tetraprenyl-beta-curcumene cyclase